jgi:hypothetical protein
MSSIGDYRSISNSAAAASLPQAIRKNEKSQKGQSSGEQDAAGTAPEESFAAGREVSDKPSPGATKAEPSALVQFRSAYAAALQGEAKKGQGPGAPPSSPQGAVVAEEEKKPLSDDEKAKSATLPKEGEDKAIRDLKDDYRKRYDDAGHDLDYARKAAEKGMGSREVEDGARQEVSAMENGNTSVKTTQKDGSSRTIQFNPDYPGRVVIQERGAPGVDTEGREVPGKEETILRNGTTITLGPGVTETLNGRGKAPNTVMYEIDQRGNPTRLEIRGSRDDTAPYSSLRTCIDREGKFKTIPTDVNYTRDQIERAEKSDEIPQLHRAIQGNDAFRDGQGRPIDGRGQTVATLEMDIDLFSGRLPAHTTAVNDAISSEKNGIATQATIRPFEKRPEDASGLLPGFRTSHGPPDEIAIPDNKKALVSALDTAMRFDKRIVPELQNILDAQKSGAGMSALNMSFGETPTLYAEQVFHLLDAREPGNSDRYAYPNLRKELIGPTEKDLPSREAIEKDPAGIMGRLNEKRADGGYANPELRRALLGDDEKSHPSPEALQSQQDTLLARITMKDEKGDYTEANLRETVLGRDGGGAMTEDQKKKAMEFVLQGYRTERLGTKAAGFVRDRMNDPAGGFQQALGNYRGVLRELAENGITTVVAANNDQIDGPRGRATPPYWDSMSPGSTLNYFGYSPDALTVAASDSNGTPGNYGDDRIAPFSSHGDGRTDFNPIISAPGYQRKTASGMLADGTSVAAPHVAGTITLMKQANPSLTPAQIRKILLETVSKDVAGREGVAAAGAGIVNPEAAVRRVLSEAGLLRE